MCEKGLYIHIPFCKTKCNYCDFYSLNNINEYADKYIDAVIRELGRYSSFKANTLYLGGGTPSVIGPKNLARLLNAVNKKFGPFSEATLEANPGDNLTEVFKTAKNYGINRVSLGVQSGVDEELKILGRRHNTDDAKRTVEALHKVGLTNYSLDLMIGIPHQTESSLAQSVNFLTSLEPCHISSYLLKIEEGTPFFKMQNSLNLPDSDTAAELYLQSVNLLEEKGFLQYEISNFAKEGFEAKHNLKYWNCEEYIGIGPSAHGFLGGKRYYYPRSLEGFIKNPTPVFDCDGGGYSEYLMLKLRLKSGVDLAEFENRFSLSTSALIKKAQLFKNAGYITLNGNNLALTARGFLVSNTIISEFLNCL